MRSLRFQLIFWNTVVLGVLLLAVSGTVAALNLNRLSDGIDRELVERSRGFGRGPGFRRNFEGPGGQQNPPPITNPQREEPGATTMPIQAQGGPEGQGRGRQGQGGPDGFRRFQDPDDERLATIRRPRVYGADGQPLPGVPQDVVLDPNALKQYRGTPIFSYATYQGERVRVYTTRAFPIFGEGAILQLGRDLRDYHQLLRVQAVTLATVIPVGLIVAALLAWFLTARAMRPIRQMGTAAAAIGHGNFDQRIPVVGTDEFAELGTRFNEMAAALGASFAQQKASYEALAAAYEQQRQFVADASHELRTPLTRLQLVTSEALSDPSADTRRAVEVADGSARAMAGLVRQLLELAQADAGELRPQRQDVDLRALVADVVDEMQDGEVDVQLGDAPRPVSVDPALVARALTNLIENAKRYGAGSRRPVVTVGREDGVGTWIEVRDFGAGIPAEHLPHVTKRFYRADQARTRELGGTGLGLAIVDEIMRAHGGHLAIESTEGQGTTARLVFP